MSRASPLRCCGPASYSPLPQLALSVLLHGAVLVALPMLMSRLAKPRQFTRPRTFQLVTYSPPRTSAAVRAPAVSPPPALQQPPPTPAAPQPSPRPAPAAKPKPAPRSDPPAASRPAAAPQPPQEQRREEDLSELAELLGAIGPPRVEHAVASEFKYNWYLNVITGKVEQHWKPHYEDRSTYVEVAFTIFRNGTISNVTVRRSSGNATLDNLALRAVSLAAPFGELPVGWPGTSLEIRYTLRPTRK